MRQSCIQIARKHSVRNLSQWRPARAIFVQHILAGWLMVRISRVVWESLMNLISCVFAGTCEYSNPSYESLLTPYYSTEFEQRAQEILVSQTQPLSSTCQSTSQSVTSSSASDTSFRSSQAPLPSASASALPAGGKVNIAAVISGSLGGVLGLVILGAITAILRYRRRLRELRAGKELALDSLDLASNKSEEMPTSVITPFLERTRAVASSGPLPSESIIY